MHLCIHIIVFFTNNVIQSSFIFGVSNRDSIGCTSVLRLAYMTGLLCNSLFVCVIHTDSLEWSTYTHFIHACRPTLLGCHGLEWTEWSRDQSKQAKSYRSNSKKATTAIYFFLHLTTCYFRRLPMHNTLT